MSMQHHHLAALLGCTALAFSLPAFSQAAAPAADASAAFKRADANGDGKLSKAEAASLPAIASRFDELDADKDSFLSMAEFNTGLTAPK